MRERIVLWCLGHQLMQQFALRMTTKVCACVHVVWCMCTMLYTYIRVCGVVDCGSFVCVHVVCDVCTCCVWCVYMLCVVCVYMLCVVCVHVVCGVCTCCVWCVYMLCVVCVHVVCGVCTCCVWCVCTCCVWCVYMLCVVCVHVVCCVCVHVVCGVCYVCVYMHALWYVRTCLYVMICSENCTGGIAHFLLAEIFIMFEVDELNVNEGDGLVELCLRSSEPFPEYTILPVSFSGCSGDQCGEWDRAATGERRGGG